MIIDSKKYNGICSCGHKHTMTTEFCVIESGCLANIYEYIKKCGLKGFSVAIYDVNTYNATNGWHPKADREIILPPENLHADNHGVALAMERIPENCDYMIAVGSGTIHDITRYCAYKKGVPFVSCPTAASVDGFCSSVAAMTWDGFKKTFEAVAPKIVVADLAIISKAPTFLTNAGFGDMIGKFIALADWKTAHTLTGEYFCKTIHDMTLDATKAVTESAEAIKAGDVAAYEKLIYGLLMSGLAMQMLGNSRCASGAEHHISHLIEMQPEHLGVKSDALHGEKVGVGTLLACREYHRLKDSRVKWGNYRQASPEYIKEMFGNTLGLSITEENTKDCARGITAQLIEEKWEQIRDIIGTVPTYKELMERYEILGVKSSLVDIDVPPEKTNLLLEYSPLVRNRLTLMRLRRAIIGEESK
jgi:glycerol-1-phosphate dehydrogenase [NAD(P)+]